MNNPTSRRGKGTNLYLTPEVFSEFKDLIKKYDLSASAAVDRLMYEALKLHGREPKSAEIDRVIAKTLSLIGPSPAADIDAVEKTAKRDARRSRGKA